MKQFTTATKIGNQFNLSSRRINSIFSKIGWIEKNIKGWNITDLGKQVGGKQLEHTSGKIYVVWDENIMKNKLFLNSINYKDSNIFENSENITTSNSDLNDFRKKYPANIRAKDGHQVRSRAEVIIDNTLYEFGLAHAYERKLPVKEDVYSDFYIPAKNGGKAIYIEFWGLENEPRYLKRKKIKQEIYKKYKLNLIELQDKHIENLDDYLPRMLLQFDIRVE